jgi:hypothetical protein
MLQPLIHPKAALSDPVPDLPNEEAALREHYRDNAAVLAALDPSRRRMSTESSSRHDRYVRPMRSRMARSSARASRRRAMAAWV